MALQQFVDQIQAAAGLSLTEQQSEQYIRLCLRNILDFYADVPGHAGLSHIAEMRPDGNFDALFLSRWERFCRRADEALELSLSASDHQAVANVILGALLASSAAQIDAVITEAG